MKKAERIFGTLFVLFLAFSVQFLQLALVSDWVVDWIFCGIISLGCLLFSLFSLFIVVTNE
jgi:uncharacterized membrane protein